MAISAIGGMTEQQVASSVASTQQLSDQFLHMLVTQLKNQDPLEPMKNEQFITELAQLQSLDTSMKTATTTQALLLQSSLATGASLIGKSVTGLSGEGDAVAEVSGVVTSVNVEEGKVLYALKSSDGKEYKMLAEDLLSIEQADKTVSGLQKPLFVRN